jgi:hypothetical protein
VSPRPTNLATPKLLTRRQWRLWDRRGRRCVLLSRREGRVPMRNWRRLSGRSVAFQPRRLGSGSAARRRQTHVSRVLFLCAGKEVFRRKAHHRRGMRSGFKHRRAERAWSAAWRFTARPGQVLGEGRARRGGRPHRRCWVSFWRQPQGRRRRGR